MKKLGLIILLSIICAKSFAVHEATAFGKIVGIESRDWGMHIQTDFAGGASNGCPVNVGDTYMFDMKYDNSRFGGDASDEISMILAAYASQTKIAFHVYGCNGSRPEIGYIRLSK